MAVPKSRTPARAWFWAGLVLPAWVVASGCAGLDAVDRHINRTAARQSEAVGGDAIAPKLRDPGDWRARTPTEYQPRPRSVNPSAEDLSYRGAEAGRDVLSRLDSYSLDPPGAERWTLEDVFRVAQTSAREYLTAEEEYLLAVIRLLTEQHRWGPRLFDDLTSTIESEATAGESTAALRVINELRATQRLPYGGEVEARLITSAARQLTRIVGEEYSQSSQLVLSANVPLLRNAGLAAREDLIQAERDVVYAARTFEEFRRRFFVDIATDYFSLVAQQDVIRNQEVRLRSVMRFLEQTEALVKAGRERPFQARNIEQNVLTSRNALINSREQYILGLDRLKVRLGIPVERPIVLVRQTFDFDDPEVSVAEAAETALRYRLDYQNERDRVDDARRRVAIARNQLLPDLQATASATLNTDPDDRVGGLRFDGGETDYRGTITFGLPIDREIERLELRRSIIDLQQQQRRFEQFEDNVVLEARQAVREIDRARFSVTLQERAVEINELRLEEIEIKRAEVDTQTRLDAENELLQSRNDRDQAVRDLRVSILEYLMRTGQLRVGPAGQFKPLRGMTIRVQSVEGDVAPEVPVPEAVGDGVPR